MTNFGERMAKRPAIPLLVVLVVTMASLGIIAINPPSFDMEEGSFMPDNDITNAATAVSEAFSSSTSVMSMIDASDADGNVFTRDVFISVLEYERDLYNMRYISAVDGSQQPYYDIQGGVNVNGFTIMNPITTIASALTSIPINDPSADYDMLIAALENVSDIQIQIASYQVLNSEQGAPLVSMFTTDITFTPIDQTTGTASAKGFLMMTMVLSDVVENNIADGAVGFEKDVLAATDLYKEGGTITSGLMIGVVDLNTMMAEIGNMAMEDLSMLIPIALVLIIVILLLMYRDFVDMLIGIFGLILAIIWTFGISTALGVEMTTIAIAVPILILGLGIDYGLHLVFRYREERSEGHDSAGASGRTVNSVGEALVLATVTTVIAFLSYLTSSMSALADFGVMCAIGIISAFIVMLLLIPSMQSIRDRRSDKKGKPSTELKRYRKSKSQSGDIIGKVAGIGGRISAKSPWAVLGVTCIAVLGLGYSATNLSYEFDMYDFIPEGTEASDTLNYLNDNYSTTTNTANIMIYGDGWQLETLWAMEESIDNLKAHPVNGLSYLNGNGLDEPNYVISILKEAADRALSDPTLSAYTNSYNAVFDSDGRLLSSTTQAYVDDLKTAFYSETSFSGYHQSMSGVAGEYRGEAVTQIILKITEEAAEGGDLTLSMMHGVNDAIAEPFGNAEIKAVTTGTAISMAVNLDEMNNSQMSSLLMTLIMVLIILTIAMYYTDRSWLLGTMATIPTLISVVFVWGTMALLGIPLNVLTLTIASLTVGMGVTYGIHIAHRFVTDLRDFGHSARDAIRTATRETGKGVFGAALTTAAGFGVIGFSGMIPMQQFGLITALAIVFGYIGATFILPALLVIWGEHTKPKAGRSKESVAEKADE